MIGRLLTDPPTTGVVHSLMWSCFVWYQIGVHGIQIDFADDKSSDGGDSYSDTYLPEVAKEQGMFGTDRPHEIRRLID